MYAGTEKSRSFCLRLTAADLVFSVKQKGEVKVTERKMLFISFDTGTFQVCTDNFT